MINVFLKNDLGDSGSMHHMCAIKRRSMYKLYNYYPIFYCGLYSKASNITENLCTKQGNVSLKSPGYNGMRTVGTNKTIRIS